MLKNILLIIVIMVGAIGNTNAAVSGFAGSSKNGPPTCPNSVMGNPLSGTQVWSFSGNLCTMGSPGYVPSSGYYFAQTDIMRNFSLMYSFKSNSAYIDGSKPVNSQTISLSAPGSYSLTLYTGEWTTLCAYLVNSVGTKYILGDYQQACYGAPLPYTPTVPDTSCTINSGNALSVSLGTLNRDEIPTVPDSGSAISKTISVTCTGGKVTANMKLNYTPISIGSSQAVKSSTNGVGAAIFYGNKALSPSDVTPLNFLEGSNTLTLGFQAVRDSTVALKDIPTGAFTANAVLVMTQQ
ncbi:fimbrial protein [Lelliottia amnigena]|jgi:type 1 fimbria pilin|uniref:fimbrial protein n=2 Tax=Lelliottia amnigena TaxID=61646 RepID=UPI001F260133|nr:fimbrial protein [Lelliottia amnigena]MCE9966393.1 fimbrial protein [Lelliottia amnigena]